MKSKIQMDYIYMEDGTSVLIEEIQRETRKNLIAQYTQCRKDKKLTQEELAKLSGMSRTNITRFESGKYNPTLEMMVKIASALDMKLTVGLEEKNE